MTKTPRNRFLCDSIKPGRRILDSNGKVIVIDQQVIVLIRHDRAGLDHFLKPVLCSRHADSRISPELLLEKCSQLFVALRDTPLRCSMNRAFCFSLTGVKRHLRIAVVVAEYTSRISRIFPFCRTKMINKLAIPVLCGRYRSAPEVLLHMQNMILEVFEVIIRSFGSLQIRRMLADDNIGPLSRFITLQMP